MNVSTQNRSYFDSVPVGTIFTALRIIDSKSGDLKAGQSYLIIKHTDEHFKHISNGKAISRPNTNRELWNKRYWSDVQLEPNIKYDFKLDKLIEGISWGIGSKIGNVI